ncbi:MAG: hypothetical protein PHU21_06230 [Elusimicrobia bacterium]|nr:hypothetical protein [Elusimicrobiota bacterium]
MNRNPDFKGVLLAAAVAIFAGCGIPTIKDYSPQAVPAPAGAPALRVAVALTDNQSPTPSESEMNEKLADIRAQHKSAFVTPEVNVVANYSTNKGSPIGPEALTEILIKELQATEAFTSVENEGAGPADAVVKPVLKTCVYTIFGNTHYVFDLEMQVSVTKKGRKVMDKGYARRWQNLGMNIFKQLYQELLPEVMKEIRNDIVASLKR